MSDAFLCLVFIFLVILVIVFISLANCFNNFLDSKLDYYKERKKLYKRMNWLISATIMEMEKPEKVLHPPPKVEK